MMEDESELALCRLLRLLLSRGRFAASAPSSSSSLSTPPANAEGGAGGELPPARDFAGEALRFEASLGGSLAASSFFDVQRGVVWSIRFFSPCSHRVEHHIRCRLRTVSESLLMMRDKANSHPGGREVGCHNSDQGHQAYIIW